MFESAAAWWRQRFRPRSLGERGEQVAARYLRRQGFRIIARGQRSTLGEIDLIAVDPTGDARVLVFVEVKTRADHVGGHPAEAVDRRKQEQITRLAAVYRKHHGLLDVPTRFDIVAVTWPPTARRPTIEHFVNAFEATGGGRFD